MSRRKWNYLKLITNVVETADSTIMMGNSTAILNEELFVVWYVTETTKIRKTEFVYEPRIPTTYPYLGSGSPPLGEKCFVQTGDTFITSLICCRICKYNRIHSHFSERFPFSILIYFLALHSKICARCDDWPSASIWDPWDNELSIKRNKNWK